MTRRSLFRAVLALPLAAIMPWHGWIGVDRADTCDVTVVDLMSSLTVTCEGVTTVLPVRISAVYSPSSCLPKTLSDLERRICKLVTTKIS